MLKTGKLPEYKIGEFKRQLNGQEDGLNWMTVEEFLENVSSPSKRKSGTAKKARERYQGSIQQSIENELQKTMDAFKAQQVAIEKTLNRMSVLAALHNPDLIAGGKDAISDFGDRKVNSTIGPQWKSKIPNLKKTAETVPPELRGTTRMNVKLHKC